MSTGLLSVSSPIILRATSFLIADGVLPGNEGRGYVLRRIMRRAMRHAHMLGAKEPMIYRLVPELVKQMGTAYPEIVRAQPLITETLKLEESRFKQMLDRGLKLLDEETGKLSQDNALPGEVAFKLYDTFGFPLDLTQDVLRGQGKKVDVAGFETAMAKQKAAARAAWSGSGEIGTAKMWFELRDELGATEFLGYSTEKAEGQIKAIVKNGARVAEAKAGEEIQIIVNQTPFYAESGGQVGDTGTITTLQRRGYRYRRYAERSRKRLGASRPRRKAARSKPVIWWSCRWMANAVRACAAITPLRICCMKPCAASWARM